MSCLLSAVLVAALGFGPAPACGGLDGVEQREPPSAHRTDQPLAGRIIVLDAGHQLGNHNFPAQINRPVNAGGSTVE